jgi:hypothetical protein
MFAFRILQQASQKANVNAFFLHICFMASSFLYAAIDMRIAEECGAEERLTYDD